MRTVQPGKPARCFNGEHARSLRVKAAERPTIRIDASKTGSDACLEPCDDTLARIRILADGEEGEARGAWNANRENARAKNDEEAEEDEA